MPRRLLRLTMVSRRSVRRAIAFSIRLAVGGLRSAARGARIPGCGYAVRASLPVLPLRMVRRLETGGRVGHRAAVAPVPARVDLAGAPQVAPVEVGPQRGQEH